MGSGPRIRGPQGNLIAKTQNKKITPRIKNYSDHCRIVSNGQKPKESERILSPTLI